MNIIILYCHLTILQEKKCGKDSILSSVRIALRSLSIFALLLLLSLAGVVVWQSQKTNLRDEFSRLLTPLGPFLEKLTDVTEVLTPEPLKGPLGQSGGTLTTSGILTETNRHRALYNLPILAANSTLEKAAQKKVADMFARQYFAHEAPDGTGPADLVTSVGYEYIRVGENLALGNFASDQELVQAWMDSPGHRANILHTGFSEIGLAVGRGNFEGTEVWLAVQTFAAPLSDCPEVDPRLQKEFDQQKANLENISNDLTTEYTTLQAEEAALTQRAEEIKKLLQEGNNKIAAGNEEIQRGNAVYQETGDTNEAQPYWDRGRQLQAEGEALIEQGKAKQDDLDAAQAAYDEKRLAFNQEVEKQSTEKKSITSTMNKLNQQIRTFNNCVK
jgi:uncharacterized protein YkwD